MYEGLGNNLFIEMFFAGTKPTTPKQDYIFGGNDLQEAKALRYKMKQNFTLKEDGFTDGWVKNYAVFLQSSKNDLYCNRLGSIRIRFGPWPRCFRIWF